MFRHLKTGWLVNISRSKIKLILILVSLMPHLHAVPQYFEDANLSPDSKVILSPLAKLNLLKARGEYLAMIDTNETSRQTFLIVLFTSVLQSQAKTNVTSFDDFSRELANWKLAPKSFAENYNAGKTLVKYQVLFSQFEKYPGQYSFAATMVTVPKWLNSTMHDLADESCDLDDDGQLMCTYEAVFNQFLLRYSWGTKQPFDELTGIFFQSRTAEFLVTVWPRFKEVLKFVITLGKGNLRVAFNYGLGPGYESVKNVYNADEKAEWNRDYGAGSEEDLDVDDYIEVELARCFRLIKTDNDRTLFIIVTMTSYAQSPVKVPAKYTQKMDDVMEYFKALHVAPKSIFPIAPLVLKKYSKHFHFFRREPQFFQPRRFNVAFARIPALFSSIFTDLLPKCTAKGGEYRCMYGDVFRGLKQGFVDAKRNTSLLKDYSFLIRREAEMLFTVWARFKELRSKVGEDMSAAFNIGPNGRFLR